MAHGEEIQRGSAELSLRNQRWTPILRDRNMTHSLVDGERVISGLPGDGHGKNKGFTSHTSHHRGEGSRWGYVHHDTHHASAFEVGILLTRIHMLENFLLAK
jgi:hypothetical protein